MIVLFLAFLAPILLARFRRIPVVVGKEDFPRVIDALAYKGILALCIDDDWNLVLGRAGVQAGVRPVIARVNNPANLQAYQELDIQPYMPSLAQPTLLALMVRNPDFHTLLTFVTDGRDVREIENRNRKQANRKLRDLRLPGELLVMTISRNSEVISPHGNIQFELGTT